MKKSRFNILYILTSLLVVASCGIDKETASPFGWTPSGMPSDSLLVGMDRAMLSYADPEVLDSLVEKFCRMSKSEDPEGKYEHRRLYWKGNVLFMRGDYERGDSLRRLALACCDSSVFPRDFRLYRMAIEQPSDFPDNISRYERYKDDLDVFVRSGDFVSGFSRAVLLAGLLSEAGMNREALEYAILSDSLLAKTDLPVLRMNNRINLASAYCCAGDTAKGIGELHAVMSSPESYSIPSISAITDYNLFQISGDTAALLKAWDKARHYPELAKMRPLVAASIVRTGNMKSADARDLRDALNLSLYYDYTHAELLEIREAALKDAVESGVGVRIIKASDDYEKAVNDYLDVRRRGEVVGAQTAAEIRRAEEGERARREAMYTRIRVVIAIGIFCLSATGIFLYRHIERHKRIAVLNQLESERLRREMIAREMMIVEKQKLNEKLQKKIDDLVESRNVEKKTAESISNIIVAANVADRIEPEDTEFLKRFIEKYPDVGKTGRRIALYIRNGLDTSRIALEMNIRKESVMQGRWRLRSQMGLAPEQDLDVEVRKC